MTTMTMEHEQGPPAGNMLSTPLSVFLTDALGVSESGCVDVLKRW